MGTLVFLVMYVTIFHSSLCRRPRFNTITNKKWGWTRFILTTLSFFMSQRYWTLYFQLLNKNTFFLLFTCRLWMHICPFHSKFHSSAMETSQYKEVILITCMCFNIHYTNTIALIFLLLVLCTCNRGYSWVTRSTWVPMCEKKDELHFSCTILVSAYLSKSRS